MKTVALARPIGCAYAASPKAASVAGPAAVLATPWPPFMLGLIRTCIVHAA
eukprot:CAMPEP_0117617796 /NCGR_PEP_ID=MMETSP0784-20121206/85774_1 /TAXON_ID=39447 /ORGANISM="" /LENGTH=50 /DNA_ID=CAMNT_0005421643 /DNA_START=56 /DNA_END=205 /DNA_ORIENTATION=-